MNRHDAISGFTDEISSDFTKQLKTLVELGMKYISLRSADEKGIGEYTLQEVDHPVDEDLYLAELNKRIEAEKKFLPR